MHDLYIVGLSFATNSMGLSYSLLRGEPRKSCTGKGGALWSLKVSKTGRKHICNFLSVIFHCNCMPIFYLFQGPAH